MNQPLHLNPDHYLGTPRIWTPERNQQAWEACYRDLETFLQRHAGAATLYIVCGIQGGGKSSWIRDNLHTLAAPAVVLDAALPGARHRARAVTLAGIYGCRAEAVWINTPLETALSWNRLRPADEQVPEEAIHAVSENFEPPTLEEGFADVHEVRRS
ncbi:MAG: hypothetical protein GAK35_00188 [Herbaspirillum frisingense]|uniref:Kinase n=1 Tax=Herbaspirillum frisingense TaxID=92645 RepID=A0A7V8G0C3_9BURK|nr:MAG: hypothetical protein GAK35_00188 [Herbaspirillum frisingense]